MRGLALFYLLRPGKRFSYRKRVNGTDSLDQSVCFTKTAGMKFASSSRRLRGMSCLLVATASGLLHAGPPLKFAFQPGQFGPSFVTISGDGPFSARSGYGMESDGKAEDLTGKSMFSGRFSVLLEEGNYDIKVTFGQKDRDTETTLKVEDRRVMLAQVKTKSGATVSRSFTVNIRTPKMQEDGPVKLNGREAGPPLIPRWDEKLTLECLGTQTGLRTLEISRNDTALTVFLAGDSTVTEQHAEPYAGWGQMLPLFFGLGTAIANHAESGLALNSFRSQRRLEKILQSLRPGDYVFVQFGHNDQKEKTPGSGPFPSFKERLKEYVHEIRARKGQPVVVTPMERRRFKDDQPYATLQEFAAAARQVAREEKAPLIDLNSMSLTLYEALGREDSRKAFVHYPAGTFPGQDKKMEDDTHHNAYGGLQLAKCIVEGIRANVPELAARLRPETPKYDPRRPDPPDDFKIPASPFQATSKPAGN